MQNQTSDSPIRLDASTAVRSSLRVTRVGMFLAETMTRHVIDGLNSTAAESARELGWMAENLAALSGVRPHVTGEVPREPCVIVANHISYLDPLVIASLVPCVPVAKAELRDWPVLGETARRSNVLFVRRECALSGARVLREARRALDRGVSVLIFPEGTTTRGHHVLPFRRGAMGLAQWAKVPIVPVAISYPSPEAPWVDDDTFLPHFMRTLARPLTSVEVQFLASIHATDNETPDAMAERVRHEIARTLATRSISHRAGWAPGFAREAVRAHPLRPAFA